MGARRVRNEKLRKSVWLNESGERGEPKECAVKAAVRRNEMLAVSDEEEKERSIETYKEEKMGFEEVTTSE